MDWDAAIEKNREALKRVLAMLVAMAEVGGQFTFFRRKGDDRPDGALAEKGKRSPTLTLPRQLYRAVLGLLRPAEAAARRLIIVAARGLAVALPPLRRRMPATPRKAGRAGVRNLPPRIPALPLFDRLSPWKSRVRPAAAGVPRISVPGYSEPFPVRLPSASDPIDASRLAARLRALAAALDDLPGHAKRFARWRARAMEVRARPQSPLPPCGQDNRLWRSTPTPSRASPEPPLPRPTGERKHQSPMLPSSPPSNGGEVASPQGSSEWGSTAHLVHVRSGVRRTRPSPVSSAATPARRVWPLCPGRPPGWRRKPTHEVHEVLDVVHGLAFWVLEAPDTS